MDRNPKDSDRLLSIKDASKELRAARFAFLNKNSFNGLYRVNSLGFYNVPSKYTPTKTFDDNNIYNIQNYLKLSVIIENKDFYEVAKKASKGDFVYFDSPYDYEEGQKGFDSYQKEGFGNGGQRKLAKLVVELDKKGVMVMISNHDTKLIKELYKGFNIKKIYVNRLVGGKGATRKLVKEFLVANYGKY